MREAKLLALALTVVGAMACGGGNGPEGDAAVDVGVPDGELSDDGTADSESPDLTSDMPECAEALEPCEPRCCSGICERQPDGRLICA